jgi:hypothetical protein
VPRWKLCYRRIQDPRNFAMVWVQELLQEQKAVFGPDPWPYNLEDNRKAGGYALSALGRSAVQHIRALAGLNA